MRFSIKSIPTMCLLFFIYCLYFVSQGAADQRFNLSMNTACDEIYQEDVWLSIANRMFRHYNAYTLFDINGNTSHPP